MTKKIWTAKARAEFAARMKAARRKKNPAKFDRCVRKVKKSLNKYRRKGSAYAICAAAETRKRDKNPTMPKHIPVAIRNLAMKHGIPLRMVSVAADEWYYQIGDNFRTASKRPTARQAMALLRHYLKRSGERAGKWSRTKNPVRVRDPEHKALVGKLRRHFSHDEAMLKRVRRKNPPRDRFILKLERGTGKVTLYYDGANFTAMRSRAHRFSSKEMAVLMGKHVLKKYPVLRGTATHPFRLYVTRP